MWHKGRTLLLQHSVPNSSIVLTKARALHRQRAQLVHSSAETMSGTDKPDADQPVCSTSGRPPVGRQLLSVAPMMDWTDVHFRQLARLISSRTWLWTEMVVDKTILYSDKVDKYLWFPPEQHPIVLQLGGSDPETLRAAATVAARYGYDEINLNCGCPSDRVAGSGCFGASLMLEADLVADCMTAVAEGVGPQTPVTVKCRLGVDQADSYQQLRTFVKIVSERSGVQHFIVHARKCYLQGLSPAENRTVPPLRHEWVWALKRDFPHLRFSLNGGVKSAAEAAAAISFDVPGLGPGAIEGVMIGRAAFYDPWGCLSDADRAVFGDDGAHNDSAARKSGLKTRREVLEAYCVYADGIQARWGTKPDGHQDPNVRTLAKPLLNLFHGERGCKRWKQAMDKVFRDNLPSLRDVLAETLHHIPDEVLDAPAKQIGPRAASGFDWQGNVVVPPAPLASSTTINSDAPSECDEQSAAMQADSSAPVAAAAPSPVASTGSGPVTYQLGDLPVSGSERAGIHQDGGEAALPAKQEMNEAKRRYRQSLPSQAPPGKRQDLSEVAASVPAAVPSVAG